MIKKGNNRSKDVRGRIIEEALRLFGEQGFDGTSIQAIADAVGIREPSLLYHFGSKNQLRDEVVNEILAYWKEALPRLLASASGRERFSAVVSAVIEFFVEDCNRARFALREMLDRPSEIGALINEQIGSWITILAGFIRSGQKSGDIRKSINPEAYIARVITLVASAVALRGVTATIVGSNVKNTADDFDDLIRVARDILFVDTRQ